MSKAKKRKPREYYITVWNGLTAKRLKRDAYWLNVTTSLEVAKSYLNPDSGDRIIKVREVKR